VHATAEAGRRAGHQAAATARAQGQVAAEAVQRQLDTALDSARESAEHLREAAANAPVVQKVSPKARRRAAELEQARLRAAYRRRMALLVLLGAGVVGAVALILKRRAVRTAAIESTDVPEESDVLIVEETAAASVDLTDGSSQTPGAVRASGGDGQSGSAG
jgi:hypothetical protein